MTRPSFDLVNGPACCVSAFLEGRTWGRAEGLAEGRTIGRQEERDEVAALQVEAARIIRNLSELDERDRDADEQRAETRRAWWAGRRGETSTGQGAA